MRKIKFLFIATMFLVFLIVSNAHADLKQIKFYKEAFPQAKPKCIECHVQEKPKKDDGMHDPNDYTKAVLEKSKEPTAKTYKEVGKVEDFKKQ